MKKLLTFTILTYLSFVINSHGVTENQNNLENEKILKIGVLLPLSGKFQDIGESFLKSIQLAMYDISNKNIKIYLKDSKGNALGAYQSAKEFEEQGIKIVIGPIFYESLERLNEINNVTFISLTNNTKNIHSNVIAFGININSQIEALKQYFNGKKIAKTLLLSPKTQFLNQTENFEKSDFKLYEVFFYDTSPKKITSEIEKLTKYQERKKDLERRIKILEKSDIYKHKQELKQLEQMHTLGKVSFFTVNQWFDNTLFNESALQNLHFPAVDYDNLIKFSKKFSNTFNEKPNKVSILAYDALGLIYYCWINNNFVFEKDQLYNKKGFKGLHGKFVIKNNISRQNLKIYKVLDKKFIKVY